MAARTKRRPTAAQVGQQTDWYAPRKVERRDRQVGKQNQNVPLGKLDGTTEDQNMSINERYLRISRTAATAATVIFAVSAMLMPLLSEAKSSRSKTTASQEQAQPGQELPPGAEPRASNYQRTVSLTFKQMGAWSSINLRGVDASRTLAFPIRSDEVVVAARLRFAFDYSPALIPELSHLRVLLNERTVTLEALRKDKELGNAREINLDPRLFKDLNYLRFNSIAHYTRQCEDPFHSSLWVTISDQSRMELTLAPAARVNDLKYLPSPFLDKAESTALKLPFVFGGAPSFGTIRAAGVVASWFGMQAGVRGVEFPVSLNALPDGNAVVFVQSGDNIDSIRGTNGASISIQNHPTNLAAKLLVIAGSSDEEMERAARALALIAPTLSGQQVSVTSETPAAPRKPYDAPAWISTDRPVRFGEIAKLEELRVQGYFPEVVRLNYRVSPDLFTWRTPGVPVNLKYRSIRLPMHRSSSLNVGINNNFIDALPLNVPFKRANDLEQINPAKGENTSLREELLFVPPYGVGGRDQLQFSYFFDVIREGECRNMPPDNLQAAIDAESTIDFSKFPRYVAMPNLAYFANIGFPFTRMADLSETAIVLPERPGPDELGMYLTVLGRMGEATAYPSLRHAVVSSGEVEKMSARDLIVIGSSSNQSLMTKWASNLPMVKINGERHVREPVAKWLPTYRWEQQDVQPLPSPQGSLNLTGNGNLTALMAFESPVQAQRSVVLMYADKAGDLRKISDVLTDPERIPSVQGDFAVVDEKTVEHVKASPTYYLGALPAMSKLRWFFSDQPMLLGLLGLLACLLLATALYRPLKRLLSKRIQKSS